MVSSLNILPPYSILGGYNYNVIFLALVIYSNVLTVSAKFLSANEIVAINAVID